MDRMAWGHITRPEARDDAHIPTVVPGSKAISCRWDNTSTTYTLGLAHTVEPG